MTLNFNSLCDRRSRRSVFRGKDKDNHWDKKSGESGRGSGKTPVMGAISLKSNVVCQMIEHADTTTLNRFVCKAISDKARLLSLQLMNGKTIAI
jgi:hypothetical protein